MYAKKAKQTNFHPERIFPLGRKQRRALNIEGKSWVWWHISVIPETGGWERWSYKFVASFCSLVRFCLKINSVMKTFQVVLSQVCVKMLLQTCHKWEYRRLIQRSRLGRNILKNFIFYYSITFIEFIA